ncbi:MAG TPA: right-handed parallel beta-helix repeat-containing protein [Candidatus Methylacidiphilales bacterium]|nr:right-handed parallel beta-helix repeat-containing protein [Candidatus Methylacidiphilales bacterium]
MKSLHFLLLCLATILPVLNARAEEARAVPTFQCAGLYWKPAEAAPDNPCAVGYRVKGEENWKTALPLWFDPNDHPGVPEHSKEYRGSVVNLQPDTEYEFRLTLEKSKTEVIVPMRTWSENFKVAKTITIPHDAPQPFVITEGGSKEAGYVVYTMESGAVLDAKSAPEATSNVTVNASYVILRGLNLKNANTHGIVLGDVQDIVIDKCDVSGWGRIKEDGFGANLDSAVYSKAQTLSRVIIQDCQLHHPRSNSNSWTEERMHDGKATKHPLGPQGITFIKSDGHFVIRRNKIFSDPAHKFNDSMGEVQNMSFHGFPYRDTDIHDNDVSNTYDDGIEVEGANINVRVWNNRCDDVYGAIGCAITSLGPIYIYRNVLNGARKGPKDDADSNKGAYLVKLGTEKEEVTKGKIFVFHNTMLQPPPRTGMTETSGGNAGIVFTADSKRQSNITSRNNILYVREPKRRCVNDPTKNPTNDFDYDLFNGVINAIEGAESHGIAATPSFETTVPGIYPLKAGTPGVDAGVRIPNFNDDFKGKGPDMGAFETP